MYFCIALIKFLNFINKITISNLSWGKATLILYHTKVYKYVISTKTADSWLYSQKFSAQTQSQTQTGFIRQLCQ